MIRALELRRIAVTASTLAGVLLFILACPLVFHWIQSSTSAFKPVLPNLANRSDETEILRVILRERNFYERPILLANGDLTFARSTHPLVFENVSAVICNQSPPRNAGWFACPEFDLQDVLQFQEVIQKIPRQLLLELAAANRFSTSVPVPKFDNVISLSAKQVEASFGENGWRDFYSAFPNANGLVKVSRAVISRDATMALIYVSHTCDGTCGFGALYLLRRSGNSWVISDSAGLWIS